MKLRVVAKLQPSPNRYLCGRAVMMAVVILSKFLLRIQCKQCKCLKACRKETALDGAQNADGSSYI